MDSLKQKALDFIESQRGEARDISREIWRFAEVALEEFKSAELLEDLLEQNGFEVQRGVGDLPTAFIARGGEGGPVIGILGEYDALPHCGPSHSEQGHGCGHNLFGTACAYAGIAALRALKEGGTPGQVVVYGCPAEETLEGKVYMARDGAFDGLDAVLTWHPHWGNYARGGSTNAMDSMPCEIFRESAHSARDPWNGRSALDGIEIMNYGVNMMREHMIEAARIHYVIKDGGVAPNVVPSYGRVWYYVRAPKRTIVKELTERVRNCARAGALASGTEMKETLLTAVYETLPNMAISECIQRNLEAVGAQSYTDEERAFAKSVGFDEPLSEEVLPLNMEHTRPSNERGNVSWIAPLGNLYTACHAPGTPGHSWLATQQYGMEIGEKGMITAARAMVTSALELMTDEALMKAVRAEFEEKTRGFTYDPLIPKVQKPNPLGVR
ncbi:MAG: amidohydrolase [Nitrospinota bacterium]|nr:amidohydrolase [Nitrospinota bacterium]